MTKTHAPCLANDGDDENRIIVKCDPWRIAYGMTKRRSVLKEPFSFFYST